MPALPGKEIRNGTAPAGTLQRQVSVKSHRTPGLENDIEGHSPFPPTPPSAKSLKMALSRNRVSVDVTKLMLVPNRID